MSARSTCDKNIQVRLQRLRQDQADYFDSHRIDKTTVLTLYVNATQRLPAIDEYHHNYSHVELTKNHSIAAAWPCYRKRLKRSRRIKSMRKEQYTTVVLSTQITHAQLHSQTADGIV